VPTAPTAVCELPKHAYRGVYVAYRSCSDFQKPAQRLGSAGITANVARSASAAAPSVPGTPLVRPLSAPDLVHTNSDDNRPATCKLHSLHTELATVNFTYKHFQPVYIYSAVLSTRKRRSRLEGIIKMELQEDVKLLIGFIWLRTRSSS
jgi:hypothetical protein